MRRRELPGGIPPPTKTELKRQARAVQDLAAYAEAVCLRPEMSEESRRNALERFRSLLEPGGTAEIAFASEGSAILNHG